MNPLTQFKKLPTLLLLITVSLVARAPVAHAGNFSSAPVVYWSNEARKAIVPPSAGAENYGRRGPG